MNILEHYLVREVSVEDVTEEYQQKVGRVLCEKMLKVVWDIDCYGVQETVTNYWKESTYEVNKLRGFYYG